MKLHLSKCTNSDLDKLISISRKTFIEAFAENNNPDDFKAYMKKAFSKEQLLLELANPHSSFYLVLSENEVLGYFKLNENEAQTDIKDKNAIELERIYVKNEFQGNQVGHWMLNRIKYIAANKKKSYLWLGVWEKNSNAIRFYKKNGFIKFGEHPYYIGSDKQMDWLMKLNLANLEK
ncbi:MAG: GNAT family N-acetyltransferase [Eudoraea sp.]|uniref:GNAT family N-acetyltransferase n=1 Tax=Eudoraea sp. TaxID=1979955 RepID=UPI003C76D2D6